MFDWLFGKSKGAADQTEVGGTAEIIVISRKVPLPRDQAFAVFVDKIGAWWPKDMTWAGDRLAAVVIEPRRDGHAIERDAAGAAREWGTVLSFERPSHIVIAWRKTPTGDAEPTEATASRIDVRFNAIDPQVTEVVVVHRDFPRHGDGWQAYRAKMASKTGWPRLIELYAAAAGKP